MLRPARENSLWGHRRVQSELGKLGIAVAPSTVWEILHAAGARPAPRRSDRIWRQFLRTQAAGILAVGFLPAGTVLLNRLYVLVFIEHGTRRMHLGGVTASPAGGRAVQQARNLALSPGQRSGQITFRIRGRGPGLHRLVRRRISGRRLVGTVRRAVPGRTLILGEGAAARRPHRVSNALQHGQAAPGHRTACPRPDRDTPRPGTARIRRRPVLGGLINEYTHGA